MIADRDQLRSYMFLALAIILIAALVLLLGWIGGWTFAVRIRPDFAAMVPSTAICFIGMAVGTLLLHDEGKRSTASTAISLLVAGIAAIELVAYLASGGSGIDSWVAPASIGTDAMSVATSVLFLLSAYCLLVLSLQPTRHHLSFQLAGTLGLLAGLVALVGYLFDTDALYGVFIFTAMALHTAVCFVFLFLALLMVRPGISWTGLLIGPNSGSRAARRLLPGFLIASVALAFIALLLTDRGLVERNFVLSLLAIAMAALSGVAILRNAAIENRSEKRLLATMSDLELTNSDKALLLREVYHRVKNNLQQVGALIRIEKRRVGDPQLDESFDRLADRVRTLGLVHQLLISSDTPSEVEAQVFLGDLLEAMESGHDLEERGIELTLEADPLRMHLDVAVSLGHVVNELVTNAIKHAFPPPRSGTISVKFEVGPEEIRLCVKDDGVGLPADEPLADTKKTPSTGMIITRSMVSQLHAEMSVEEADGVCVTITIPRNINEQDRYR